MPAPRLITQAENLYLDILRVVVLLVATLALIAALFGLLGASPLLKSAKSDPSSQPADVQASLGDFINQQKGVASSSTTSEGSNSSTAAPDSAKLTLAANNIVSYLKRESPPVTMPADPILGELHTLEGGVDAGHVPAYEDSLVALTHQLIISKGKPLTPSNIDKLLSWHQSQFNEAAKAEDEKAVADKAAAGAKLMFAMSAFGVFLAIIFVFIFVKIERNLRIVPVRAVE